jgi:NADH dehydrogenase
VGDFFFSSHCASEVSNMRVLVSGGTGFIGSEIIRRIRREHPDWHLRCGSRAPGLRNPFGPGVEMTLCDVRVKDSLLVATHRMDAVVHCVQFPNHPVESPRRGFTYMEIDARGTEAIVQACKENRVRRFVYLSGAGAGQGRTEPWFAAKDRAEKAVCQSGLEYVILRPSWIYGPGDHSLNRFVAFARWLPFVPVIGNGKNRVQPIWVSDVARIAVEALTSLQATNRVFELAGPETLTMDEIIHTMLRVMGRKAWARFLIHQPTWLMKALVAPLTLLPSPPISPQAIDFITGEVLVNNRNALATFGGSFASLEQGLKAYLTPQAAS